MPPSAAATAPVTSEATAVHPDLSAVPRTDFLLLALAVSGVAFSAPLISATAAPVLAIAFWRNCIATGLLSPIALLRQRPELRRLVTTDRRTLLLALAAGAFLALHFALWLPSLRMTSIASSTALCTTTPLWTTVILRLRGHRAPRTVWIGTALAFAGVLVLTGVDFSLSPRNLAGDGLALGAGVAASGYFLLGSEVRRTVSTTAYTFVCYTTTAVLLLVACLASGTALTGFSGTAWLQIVLLTACAQFLGHSLSNRVVRTLGPSMVSTAILLETPGAALIAAVWLGQLPPVAVYPAVAVILAGLVVVVRGNRRS
ncbi:DMT family transporter [Streptacidiphilus sp. PB12-B1b]|uniref:DMT family transporter n=1 Tax=Streptacidiphilus sp. PB12-B1b TaxID=2705012 RepID=UPI0015F7DDAE|nr:DMT family transporter [Streptacidiphilus sp. PB12-B1b]QMU75203.1 DMT family transporter [Streptacidiphilus sp. PB12-B1b]